MKKKGRCWKGYKPVPGKKPYSKGSCAPVSESVSRIIVEVRKRKEHPGQQTFDYANFLKVDNDASKQIRTYTRGGSPGHVINPVKERQLGFRSGHTPKKPANHPKRRKTDDSINIYNRVYNLTLNRLDEFKFKGIEFLPYGDGDLPNINDPDYERILNLRRRQISRDDKNLSDAAKEVWSNLHKSMPRAYAKMKPELDKLPDDEPLKKNPLEDTVKSLQYNTQIQGYNPRGTNKAFIRRPNSIPAYDKEGRYYNNNPESRRNTIAHEAWHARFGKLPGALRYLGQSEALASLYGGFRSPKPGSPLSKRIKSAMLMAKDYGIPLDLKRIKNRILPRKK